MLFAAPARAQEQHPVNLKDMDSSAALLQATLDLSVQMRTPLYDMSVAGEQFLTRVLSDDKTHAAILSPDKATVLSIVNATKMLVANQEFNLSSSLVIGFQKEWSSYLGTLREDPTKLQLTNLDLQIQKFQHDQKTPLDDADDAIKKLQGLVGKNDNPNLRDQYNQQIKRDQATAFGIQGKIDLLSALYQVEMHLEFPDGIPPSITLPKHAPVLSAAQLATVGVDPAAQTVVAPDPRQVLNDWSSTIERHGFSGDSAQGGSSPDPAQAPSDTLQQ